MNGVAVQPVDGRITYSNNELYDMMPILGECRRNSAEAARQYALRYLDRRHPGRGYIHGVEQRLRTLGSFHVVTPAPRIVQPYLEQPIVHQVLEQVLRSPHTSTRAIARDIRYSKSTVNRIIKKYLRMRPWKRHTVHKLQEGDFERRMAFCDWVVDRVSL